MKCLFVDGVKQVSFQEKSVQEIRAKDVIVKLESRGICGTDLTSYRYGMPNGFGHEMAGYVYKAGEESNFKEGARVFVSNTSMNLVGYSPETGYSYMGGFADYIVVKNPVENVDLYPIPDSMSFSEAALVEPFCVGMSGVKKQAFNSESKIVIFGAGIIGMCAFEYLKAKGVKNVVVADICEPRLEIAEKAGAIPFNSANGNMKEFLTEKFGLAFSMTGGMVPDVDVYIDAAGVASLIKEAVGMIKNGGAITILAVHHAPVELDLVSLMYNNVKFSGSCMFSHDDIMEAIDIISKDPDVAKTLISHEIPFENAKEAFEIADNASVSLKVMMVG